MIVPTVHRGSPVTLADRFRLRGPRLRSDGARIVLALALVATLVLLFLSARHAGAGRAAVFPEGTDTGVVALDMSASISGPIYARVREQGRALPAGLRYVESWVEANFDRCFQLMECDDALLLQRWVLQWRDLVEFEIVPVSPSKSVRELFPPAGTAPQT